MAKPTVSKLAIAAKPKPQRIPHQIDVPRTIEWLEKIGTHLEILGTLMYEKQGELDSNLVNGIESLVTHYAHEIQEYAAWLKGGAA